MGCLPELAGLAGLTPAAVEEAEELWAVAGAGGRRTTGIVGGSFTATCFPGGPTILVCILRFIAAELGSACLVCMTAICWPGLEPDAGRAEFGEAVCFCKGALPICARADEEGTLGLVVPPSVLGPVFWPDDARLVVAAPLGLLPEAVPHPTHTRISIDQHDCITHRPLTLRSCSAPRLEPGSVFHLSSLGTDGLTKLEK